MESTLVVVSLVSVALMSAMGFVTWRVLSLERRRQAARVATLVSLANEGSEEPADLQLFATDDRRQAPAEPVSMAESGIFAEPASESPAGRRIVAVAAVAAVLALAVGALLFTHGSRRGDSAVAPARAGAAAPTVATPLELVSLRHEREGDRLTITGLVRNPRQGARVERVSAVAFVFDPSGTFIASGRALVDFMTLGPGDESPFVVTVTAPGKIGRYRIGFRGENDAVVGHVDQRAGI